MTKRLTIWNTDICIKKGNTCYYYGDVDKNWVFINITSLFAYLYDTFI